MKNKDSLPQPRSVLSALSAYIPGQSDETKLKLSSNENPKGCCLSKEELHDCLENVSLYPNSSRHPLTARLCSLYACDATNIILSNGSDECFQLIAQAYLNPGDEVLSSQHTFSVYKSVTLLMDAHYKTAPMTHYATDLDALCNAITSKTRIIFIANPNNPTGDFLSASKIEAFLNKVPSNILVILDEAYKEYVQAESPQATLSLLTRFSNLVITRTFSKIYGLASLRIGYALGHTDVIANLQSVRPPFNVNTVALNAALMALYKHDFLEESRHETVAGHQQYEHAVTAWPATLLPSEANFVTLILNHHLAQDAFNHCFADDIIIRPLDSFGLKHGIRITLSSTADNQRVINSLNHFFES